MFENIDDRNWQEFTSAPMAVLMVSETHCRHCKSWKEELVQFLAEDPYGDNVRFGGVLLDGEGVQGFKEVNAEWLKLVEGYPFNVIYVAGEPQTSFYGAGVKRMVKRLDRYENKSAED